MSQTRKVTMAWLAEHGIVSDKYPEDYEHACIRDAECDRGLATIVLEDDGKFWRLEVEYHPEDWSGTNDLYDHRKYPEHEVELVLVTPVQTTTWKEVP